MNLIQYKRMLYTWLSAGLLASLCLFAPWTWPSAHADTDSGSIKPVYRVQTTVPMLALTFDDGPHPVYTAKLLRLLKSKGVRATFFLNGAQVRKHPGLVKQIVMQGHEVGNHGYVHRDLTKLTPLEIYHDLAKSHRLIERVSGQPVTYFRPMGGKLNRDVIDCARQLGMQIVLWSVDPKDWDLTNSAANIEQTLVHEVASGDIILLHDGGAHQETMMAALENVIDHLQEKGFRFVTVGELLAASRTEQKVDGPLHNRKTISHDKHKWCSCR